jgi:hypothetical protein
MTLTTTQAMAKFLEDITITEYQKTSIVAARKNRVIENLTASFPATSDLPFANAIMIGPSWPAWPCCSSWSPRAL